MTVVVVFIDITMGCKTSLSSLFMINSSANYNALLGRDWIQANWCVFFPFTNFFFFGMVMGRQTTFYCNFRFC